MASSSREVVSIGHDTPEALDRDIGMLADRALRLAATYSPSAVRLREAALWLTDLRTEVLADVLPLESPADDDRGDEMIGAQERNDARREWAA
jgi:hypothetical protein